MQEQQQAQMFGIPRRSCAAFTVIFFVLGFWIVTGSMSGGSQLVSVYRINLRVVWSDMCLCV